MLISKVESELDLKHRRYILIV